MCKPEIKGQTRMFDPESTPERAYQEDALEQMNQLRQLVAELLSEVKQCKGILAGQIKPRKLKTKKDPEDNPFAINRFPTKDRLLIVGKEGRVQYVAACLTAKTAKRLGIETGQKSRIDDNFSIILNATSGHRSTWRKRKDGSAVLYVRRAFEKGGDFRYCFFDVIQDGESLLIRGDLIEAVPYPVEGETEESEENHD